jgi:glycosyltransferase involved in cell wall biosynthesis
MQKVTGNNVKIVVLQDCKGYEYQGVEVKSFSPKSITKKDYYLGVLHNENLVNWLITENPDKIYWHDRSPSFSSKVIAEVKRKLPKVLCKGVYHSPGQSCPNRSLIHSDGGICDGRLEVTRCTRCRISKQYGKGLGIAASKVSLKLDIASKNPFSEISHANYYTSLYCSEFRDWIDILDNIQYHANWVKDLLLLNGVKEEKLIYHPLEAIYNFKLPEAKGKPHSGKLQLVCSGRCTNIKGQLLLLEALERLDGKLQEQIELHFIGPGFDGDDDYAEKVRRKIAAMPFVAQPLLLKPEAVNVFLKDKHIGIVPSLWPETGPLVILDFLQAGMKVISNQYIGIENKTIEHFEYGNSFSLVNAIEKVIQEYLDTYSIE